MTVSIRVEGIPQVSAFLKRMSDEKKKEVESAIKQSGFFIQAEVTESIAGKRAEPRSVDTGRLMGSVKATFPKQFEANVESNVEYAGKIEYGANIKGGPRHHFRNTAKRNETKVKDFIETKIKN